VAGEEGHHPASELLERGRRPPDSVRRDGHGTLQDRSRQRLDPRRRPGGRRSPARRRSRWRSAGRRR
jgi:hypothetical protein